MSKFKVGDKVALKENPYNCIGYVARCAYNFYLIMTGHNKYQMAKENEIVALQEMPDLSDGEIYHMLKPKLHKADVLKYGYYYHDHTMFNADETIKAIALAYRSGYLRAKKGRSFKIGGEKE